MNGSVEQKDSRKDNKRRPWPAFVTALVGAFVNTLRTGESPQPLADQLEAIKIALAAKMARRDRRPVYLSEITNQEAFDGHAFAAEYAKGKR